MTDNAKGTIDALKSWQRKYREAGGRGCLGCDNPWGEGHAVGCTFAITLDAAHNASDPTALDVASRALRGADGVIDAAFTIIGLEDEGDEPDSRSQTWMTKANESTKAIREALTAIASKHPGSEQT